jgi:hypothetical protein
MDAEGSATQGQSSPVPDQSRPRPVEPPRRPRDQSIRLALVGGLNILAWGKYSYATRVSTPGGQQLDYAGTQGSLGVTLFAGGAVTLPGGLRRLTVGANINLGGLAALGRPVIPDRVSTPFSKQALQDEIQRKYWNRVAWHPSLSAYIEHDLGIFDRARWRIGYQFWRQSGSFEGSFSPIPGSPAHAEYDVRLRHSSHLVRVSLNSYINLDDEDTYAVSGRSTGKSGLVRQVVVLAGTHQTVMVCVGIGPFWRF